MRTARLIVTSRLCPAPLRLGVLAVLLACAMTEVEAQAMPPSIAPLETPAAASPAQAPSSAAAPASALPTAVGPAAVGAISSGLARRIADTHAAGDAANLRDDRLSARLLEAKVNSSEVPPRELPTTAGPGQPAVPEPNTSTAAPRRPAPGTSERTALRIKVRTQALRAGLPPEIADAVAEVESGYNLEAIGGVGEIGLMQVLPSTARMLGFQGSDTELASADANIKYGVTYLARAWQLANSDLCTTVMKYRAGHGETRFSQRSVDYCRRVRAVLTSQGYPIIGSLPEINLFVPGAAGAEEFPTPRGRVSTIRTRGPRAIRGASTVVRDKSGRIVATARRRSRINWAAADQRMRAISSKVSTETLLIAR